MCKKYFLITLISLIMTACGQANVEPPVSTIERTELSSMLPQFEGEHVWILNAPDSTLSFEANYNGTFSAQFRNFETSIKLNPDDLGEAEIHAIVDLMSLDADNREVEINLPDSDWFDIKSHPFARFSSDDIVRQTNQSFTAKGKMTLKGITHPVDLDFSLKVVGA